MNAKGNVEVWLGELLDLQQKSLHGVIKDASRLINDPSFEILAFLNNFLAQVSMKELTSLTLCSLCTESHECQISLKDAEIS